MAVTRHSKKLRLGEHQANRFCIRLRDVNRQEKPPSPTEKTQLLQDIEKRLKAGVPNYFGEQRFGRDNSNLVAAQQWFTEKRPPHRKRRGMVMSAARSFLFNGVLAERVRQGNWHTPIEGDLLNNQLPTGPLWGRGRSPVTGISQQIEEQALMDFSTWCHGLEHCGLQQERRSLVLMPTSHSVNWLKNDLQLSFTLPSGCFATAVLAEVVRLLR